MRLTKEQLEEVKIKYGVDKLWSWSRVNTFLTSPYEYFLQYIKHEKPLQDDSAYAPLGTVAHDLLEEYYSNKIKKQDMADKFDETWMEQITLGSLKFNRSDEDRDNSIKSKYYDNLIHYFNNFIPLTEKVFLEKFIAVKVNDFVLQGYADIIWKDNDGYTHIGDFKTSSIYKGDNLKQKSGQLMLYALGLSQMGVPLDRIKIGFNFLKYINVEVSQKTKDKITGKHKTKIRQLERYNYVEKLDTSILMWLKTIGIEGEEAQEILDKCHNDNSLIHLPDEIKDKFKISDCWVEVELTQDNVEELVNNISETIRFIESLEEDYNQTKNEKLFWDSKESMQKESYYLSELCGYSISQHKPYKEYLDELNMFKDDIESTTEDDDTEWLKSLGLID
jgi:hypothetical protein